MFNGIHKQVLVTLILVSLINILFLGSLNLLNGNSALQEATITSAKYAREAIVQAFEKELSVTNNSLQFLNTLITDQVDVTKIYDPNYLDSTIENLAPLVKQLAQNHRLSHTAYIYINPDLTNQTFDVFYADQDFDGFVERQEKLPLSYFREGALPTDNKEWWFGALSSNTPHWSKPYVWSFDNGVSMEFVSLTQAYYFGETLFAVIGTDYLYNTLKDTVNDLKLLGTGYAFLLDENLNPMIYPEDGSYEYFKEEYSKWNTDTANFSYRIKKEESHVFTDTLSNGWILGVQFTHDEIAFSNRRYIDLILITMVVALLQSIIFSFFMSRYLSKPLLAISTLLQSNDLTKGRLSLPKKLLTRKDEIGTVSKSLAIINEDIKSHLKTISHQNSNLAFMKQFDELTSLPNEVHFKKLATDRFFLTPDKHHFIILINIDGFRLLNGLFGVHICNELLRKIAERLESLRRDGHLVARFSGDEFILCYHSEEPIYHIVGHLQSLLNGVYHIKDETIHLSVSIGISTYPTHSEEITQLIKFATIALNHSKTNKKNDWFIYAPSVTNLSSEQFKMLRALRGAIQNKELSLMIQPQFDVLKNKIVGGEVLLRWFHNGKFIAPNIFIPLSESSKLILPIGEYVVKESLNLQRELKARGLNIKIAINISVQQLTSQQVYHQLKYALAPFGLKPEDITLEITESTLLHANQEARSVLNALSNDGFKIAVDDFGTGYSSLSYIKKFKFDTLKLDRMFIKDYPESDDAAIASMIISLAKNLNVDLIAEGMETEEQVRFLKENGCTIMQGYYFSKPLTVDDFIKKIEDQSNKT